MSDNAAGLSGKPINSFEAKSGQGVNISEHVDAEQERQTRGKFPSAPISAEKINDYVSLDESAFIAEIKFLPECRPIPSGNCSPRCERYGR